jgi:hypothetical protein
MAPTEFTQTPNPRAVVPILSKEYLVRMNSTDINTAIIINIITIVFWLYSDSIVGGFLFVAVFIGMIFWYARKLKTIIANGVIVRLIPRIPIIAFFLAETSDSIEIERGDDEQNEIIYNIDEIKIIEKRNMVILYTPKRNYLVASNYDRSEFFKFWSDIEKSRKKIILNNG